MTDPQPPSRPFIQSEAFSPPSHPLLGNPCAVVLSNPTTTTTPLTPEQRQCFATWTNLSETTFLLPPTDPSKADYKVHIHTTKEELPFAGHPTLCSARAWLRQREEQGKGGERLASGDARIVTQECGVGLVRVRIDDTTSDSSSRGPLSLCAPPFLRYEPASPNEVSSICSALSIPASSVLAAQWTDNGPGWCTLLLNSARAVLEAKVVHKAPYNVGLVGPYAPAVPKLHQAGLLPESGSDVLAEEEEADTAELGLQPAHFEVRAFFDSITDEDPVTGSLNAGIAKWLIGKGWAEQTYVAAQGVKVGRRGRVVVEAEGEGAGEERTIWVGGETSVVIEGSVCV